MLWFDYWFKNKIYLQFVHPLICLLESAWILFSEAWMNKQSLVIIIRNIMELVNKKFVVFIWCCSLNCCSKKFRSKASHYLLNSAPICLFSLYSLYVQIVAGFFVLAITMRQHKCAQRRRHAVLYTEGKYDCRRNK